MDGGLPTANSFPGSVFTHAAPHSGPQVPAGCGKVDPNSGSTFPHPRRRRRRVSKTLLTRGGVVIDGTPVRGLSRRFCPQAKRRDPRELLAPRAWPQWTPSAWEINRLRPEMNTKPQTPCHRPHRPIPLLQAHRPLPQSCPGAPEPNRRPPRRSPRPPPPPPAPRHPGH